FLIADLKTNDHISDCSTSHFIAETKEVINQPLSSEGTLLIVADGMGGAAAGDIASQLAIDTVFGELSKEIDRSNTLSIVEMLKNSVEKTNTKLWEESQMNIDYRGMGTTLTAVLVYKQDLYIAQVGDSRAYLVRNREIEQVTKDQSAVQMLIDLGRISKQEAATAPNRNIILQALGVEPIVQVALTKVSIFRGDYLLLCSDGLSNKVEDEEIRDMLLSGSSIDVTCQKMVDLANFRGGEDNITVVVSRFDGEALKKPDREPIWKSIEIIESYYPSESRRGLVTSRFSQAQIDDHQRRDRKNS
ncbi:MAG: Stp1/IreP family PP2C-type Ser/Thr phosphatase, partial [Blastocatellia bacterium]|nr:Stp1/IreP family PP2C-type Ser/Thr phosphatase [Blastocatellia bacterium]